MFGRLKLTFNLPNFQGRYLKQGTPGTYESESLPNITGSLYNNQNRYQDIGLDGGVGSGAITIVTDNNNRQANGNIAGYDNKNLGWNFDASRSSSVYQNNAKVNPDNAEIMYCIKI